MGLRGVLVKAQGGWGGGKGLGKWRVGGMGGRVDI